MIHPITNFSKANELMMHCMQLTLTATYFCFIKTVSNASGQYLLFYIAII